MSSSRHPDLLVMGVNRSDTRLAWAAKELLARVGLPYRLTDATPEPQAGVVLAIGRDLPSGSDGLAVSKRDAMDSVDLAGALAEGRAESLVRADESGRRLTLPIDLVDACLDWLGRREEYPPAVRDEHGRSRFEDTALHRAGRGRVPVFDLLADLVYDALVRAASAGGMALGPRRRPWRNDAPYAAHLSHDVDTITGRYRLWSRCVAWGLRSGADLLRRRSDPLRHVRRMRRWIGGDDPQDALDRWMELEAAYGARSSFYFFCHPTGSPVGQHASRMYRMGAKVVRQRIRRVVENGWEAGVHGLYPDYTNAASFRRQRQRLADIAGVGVEGVRQHYLRLAVPETWRAQEQAGFSYDSSLGWSGEVGFRAGTCRPFWIWDHQQNRPMTLMELPLVVMDGSMTQLLGDASNWEEPLDALLGQVRRVGGVFSFLMHPDHLDDVEFPGHGRLYERLLGRLQDERAWACGGAELCRAEGEFRRELAGDR